MGYADFNTMLFGCGWRDKMGLRKSNKIDRKLKRSKYDLASV